MRNDIDKILEMLRDKTINGTEAEKLIKAIHRIEICEDIKGKARCVVDTSADVIVKAVDIAVKGVDKINPLIKGATTKITKEYRKMKSKKRPKIDIELDF